MNLDLNNCTGFEWDDGNRQKSWEKHFVTTFENEQSFFNQPILIYDDEKHSKDEIRFFLLGKTDLNRNLFVVFTIRKDKIRVISARNMNKKERLIYEKENTSV